MCSANIQGLYVIYTLQNIGVQMAWIKPTHRTQWAKNMKTNLEMMGCCLAGWRNPQPLSSYSEPFPLKLYIKTNSNSAFSMKSKPIVFSYCYNASTILGTYV